MSTLLDSLTFPWRGNAKWIFLWLIILAFGSRLAAYAPLVGFIAVLFIAAYFCATYCHLIELSTSEDELPATSPDFSNIFGDFIIPTIRVVVIGMIILIAPAVYITTTGNYPDSSLSFLLFLPGLIYAPMALLGWIVFNNPVAISPHIVIPSIFRIGVPYLWIILLLFVISAAQSFLESGVTSFPLIGILLVEISSIYVLMASARLIGAIYRDNKENLGWF